MPRTKSGPSPIDRVTDNDNFNVVDIILLDHSYVKECIEVLTDEDEQKRTKLKYAKGFLDALKKHSLSEKKAVYSHLKDVEDFRSQILEGEIEHGIVDSKVKMLIPKIAATKSLSEELEAELKVLAELVKHHLKEEEEKMLPMMKDQIDDSILNEMGYLFMLHRKFTDKDLEDSPELREEMSMLRKSPKVPASKLMNRAHDYFSSAH